MINSQEFSLPPEGLVQRDGIWFSASVPPISYPGEANKVYYEVEDKSFWFQHRNNCIIQLARQFAKEPPFFDIGGGNGFVSMGMQQAGFTSYLLEPGIHGCINGKERGIRNIICSTLQESGLNENTIPSAGLFDVAEHIEDDLAFLKQVNSFLKNEGVLILTVPAYNYLWSDEDKYIGHYKRYTLKTISAVLKQAGFKIEYKTYLFSFLIIPILLFRCVPGWLGIKTKRGDPKTVRGDHQSKGFIDKIFRSIMKWETGKVSKGKRILTGSSCLVVARKV